MDETISKPIAFLLVSSLLAILAQGNNFTSDFEVMWGDSTHATVANNGSLLMLTLDEASGANLQSYDLYQYGRLDMLVKFVPNNSQGTITTFYLSSNGTKQDEIDFEFLGNYGNKEYVVHTNVWTGGVGGREQQFHLWFDPRANFHNYSILWNPLNIMNELGAEQAVHKQLVHPLFVRCANCQTYLGWYVDGTPVRVFKNYTLKGAEYPALPMRTIVSLWNGDSWATDDGKTKIDWSQAPFRSWYANYSASDCLVSNSTMSHLSSNCSSYPWFNKTLSSDEMKNLTWVQNNYMIKNYCNDTDTYPNGFPPECYLS